jgi:hypothetical protein
MLLEILHSQMYIYSILSQNIMGLFNNQQKQIYCQNCGIDLTKLGGNVANNGKIYCNKYCMILYLMRDSAEAIIANYHDHKQVQEDIKKKILKEFGPLEAKLETKFE